MKSILFKTSNYLANLTEVFKKINEKQHIYNFTLQHLNSNIDMIYIISLVIPNKVDTSQVPQHNVKCIPTVKAMIKTT